jgi:hypothetical protein
MSAKQETTFIGGVHKQLPPGRRDPYWMKNNNQYTSGIWDVWYSGSTADLWVEYKFIDVPLRASTLILPNLSELQLQWGRERHKEGRNVAVIVGCKEGGVIYENLEWEREMSAAAFKVMVRSRAEIAKWIMAYTHLQASPKRK